MQGEALPSPAPAAAPTASPSAAASNEPHDEEQQYRTDGGIDDGADHASAEMDAQLRQQPASDKGAQNPDKEIANDPKTGPAHDLTGQPAGHKTHKQDDQEAFTRHIHCDTPACWFKRSIASRSAAVCANLIS